MRIAIVGAHLRTRLLAPFDDARWQIWACSPRNVGVLPRHDVWFELHKHHFLEPSYLNWLKQQPIVYTLSRFEDVPGSVEYPKHAMLDRFGPYFFTSTIAWMFAKALSEKPDAIGIFGVETSSPAEYADQRPAHHHFIQLARDRGIEVVAAPTSSILDAPQLYGYDQ